MKIYIICPVRKATDEQLEIVKKHVALLEFQGHEVHYPPRDVNQDQSGFQICTEHALVMKAIAQESGEVHLFLFDKSTGSYFDAGMAFMAHAFFPKLRWRVFQNVEYDSGKSFPRMFDEWESAQSLMKLHIQRDLKTRILTSKWRIRRKWYEHLWTWLLRLIGNKSQLERDLADAMAQDIAEAEDERILREMANNGSADDGVSAGPENQ